MGPSEKSFNQVKAILGKLDRSIDQLRERRSTGRDAEAPAAKPVPQADTMRSVVPGVAIPAVSPTTYARPSQYGRATPIPPSTN
jgi:hypothetical protein